MRGRGNPQMPPHGYDPRSAAFAAAWHGAASASDPAAAAMNPYPFAPNPQFGQDPFHLMLPHLLLQNQAALAAAFHHQQQFQQHQHQQQQYQQPPLPSPGYAQSPTTPNVQHRPPNPSPASAPPQQQQQQPLPPPRNPAALERAQAAATKARDELTHAGQGVTGWKVAQAALVALKADSWGSLGVQLHDVPVLRELFSIEGKVNTFIHCYVAARKIVSIHDLEVEICKNEGIGQFEELGLGPFLQHPLVAHYFFVPADLSKVPKLSSEEIISCLQKFIDNSKEKVTAESFLDHLAEQKSVSGKEKLGVRVQSLGLHISFLRQARRNEVAAIKHLGKTSGSRDSTCEKDLPKQTDFHSGKQELDKRFDDITSRIKQLPGINKHIRFDSAGDEVDDGSSSKDAVEESESEDSCYIVDRKDVDKSVSGCPYPSTAEEIKRLGLKSEQSKKPAIVSSKVKANEVNVHSRNKRKYEENGTPSSLCKQPNKRQKMQIKKKEVSPNCFLSTGKLEKFITTWKEACREHSVQQVLELIANYYTETPEEKRKMINFFSQYPGIGFLNVAVRSMACGLLDSIYDAIHVFSENKLSSSPIPNTTTEVMEIEPLSKENTKSIAKGANQPGPNVTADDVIRRITEYFESNSGVSRAGALKVENFMFLKTLHDCEIWVVTQFSAKQFTSLGHGTFLEFLGKHGDHFPPKLSSLLKRGNSNSSSLEVSVLRQQIEVLLCQAEGNWLEDGDFSGDSFLMLLKRQFPTISFDIAQFKSGEELKGSIERQRRSTHTNNITFSVSLLEKRWSGMSPGEHDTVGGQRNSSEQTYYSETVSSREATNCLLKAPMLSDLLLWSHWDMLFAPSLGSFIHWLLNAGPVQQLACIVTTDGRFIRVDPSATVDQFLEAIIQCSPFQVAVKLLSLLHIYNGSVNTPFSLLKCYAQRAIGIIMNNNKDPMNTSSDGKPFVTEGSHNLSAEQRDSSPHFVGHVQESSHLSSARNVMSDVLTNIDSTIHFVAKFFLDCLGHLPSEFRSLAADILLSGLRTVTKNCYSVILHEATETWQLCMLHDVGLSLGITEWVEDYREFCLAEGRAKTETHSSSGHTSAVSEGPTLENSNMLIPHDADMVNDSTKSFPGGKDQVLSMNNKENQNMLNPVGVKAETAFHTNQSPVRGEINLEEAALVIETIRRDEFGLDQALSCTENSLLTKQHARLGRALHCLSQELYSQDSHLLLELVQNADDNTYLEDVEPTLAFVLQDNGIVVLNNERGFSAENIRALCDIGNSTKKGANRGYIGNKGIGFKSVFRVTDAPEIHSNGFHVKFDITDGQIGFVLPTAVPPYSTSSLSRMLSVEDDKDACSRWNTCILLPFRSKFRDDTGMCSIASMFSDLHPSLLLFLNRLNCIKFKNVVNDTLLVMRRKALGDGIVRISHGNEIMSWLVVSKKLQGTLVRHDVHTTEIALAFTLQETEKGEYEPYLKQQPVFAFLPLRNYGLKFILQGDFVLPSSREEVDADNAWNQWLLSEFPSLFVSAQESFCSLPCFQSCPGKAVTAFMSFVPLAGEVHGFFCKLPHLILSKLRLNRCMVLEGSSSQWVYPCNTLRGWDEQTKMLFSDGLLHQHLGLGYLSKDIIIPDTLSRALGIHDHGPNVFIDMVSSICRTEGSIESLGMEWLCAWFVNLHLALSRSFQNIPSTTSLEGDLLCALRKLPCIPLSDGSFSSVADGPIWLPHDILGSTTDCKGSMKDFPILYGNLRFVSPLLFSVSCKNKYLIEEMRANDLTDILLKIGVRKLSGHEIIKNHILASLPNGTDAKKVDKMMMIEYVSFIMLHLQSPCTSCNFGKEEIMSELRSRPILLTNHGYKCPADEPIHFSKEYGSPVDIGKLLKNVEIRWIELDSGYLMNHGSDLLPSVLKSWRQFFEEMGVTDFVHVMKVEKNISQVDSLIAGRILQGGVSGTSCTVYDWESPELANILSSFSSKNCRENCIYLMEVLDSFWDDHYSAKAWCLTSGTSCDGNRTVESSFMKCIRSFKWIASTVDYDLHNATDLFYDCESVRSLLGGVAPYAVPQVSSGSLRNVIGFKTNVSHSDALMTLNLWMTSQVPFSASVDQMSKFYTFVSEGAADAKIDIKREFTSCSSIFTPLIRARSSEVVHGKFLSPKDLYWHDPTGCSETTEEFVLVKNRMFPRRMLCSTYPNLCEFFTEACGVPKVPTTADYVEMLLRLSKVALPSQVAHQVFRVFVRWATDIHSVSDKNDLVYVKDSLQKLETTILPTLVDKWVSLHPSFGLVCWSDDDELKQHFQNCIDVDFIQFGTLSSEDKQILYGRVAALMKSLGIPALSKVVHREAIFYGTADNREKATLLCGLLPYMQRYIYKTHRDAYINFQQNEIMKLSNLQIIVVEKLFHKYMLKGHESSSKKRFKCHCLLQGNILYATQEADSHSLFLETSRIFFDGSPDLHFANFLHMVKTMAISGTSAEQVESFVVNNQNVPALPEEEAVWSFSSSFVPEFVPDQGVDSKPVETSSACVLNIHKQHQRSDGTVSSWPPNNWRTAPDFRTSRRSQHGPLQDTKVNNDNWLPGPLQDTEVNDVELTNTEDNWFPVQLDEDWVIEEDTSLESNLHTESTVATLDEPQMVMSINADGAPAYLDLGTGSPSETEVMDFSDKMPNTSEGRERLRAAQLLKTGRVGEAVAYKHLVERLGAKNVRWVNADTETGLPYDIIITRGDNRIEYVEVKATTTSNKNWFYITAREWQFALEKGDDFSIARVMVSGEKMANIKMLKNPHKLCQKKMLHLALLIARR
ncbi:hypothetical protein VPH35_100688 [Triticum aestivum]|uniref:protein NO VEIN n=1 Tax=Triticum aestivum TaxID=4565 RepID=UPI001D02285D|nr:protein NO VEIN-like [Triticum aestivum]